MPAAPAVLCVCAALTLFSCGSFSGSGVQSQLSRGKRIYEQGCATQACHGSQGEGVPSANGFRAWPLLGQEFQRRNPTAQVVFDVVRSGGEASLRAMSDQQIYDAIAYELSLNGVQLAAVLEAQNAQKVSSGTAALKQSPGSLFPPPGNARLTSERPVPALPLTADNGVIRMRLTQLCMAAAISGTAAPNSGSYVVAVFTIEDLSPRALDVDPQYLRLTTDSGQLLEPQHASLAYPVDRFHAQAILPEHGTAAYAVFALPANAVPSQLLYSPASGPPLSLELGQ